MKVIQPYPYEIFPASYEHNNFGFMPGFQNCPNGGVLDYDLLTFRCYEDISFPNYNPNNVNCDNLMSVEQISATNFNIYPNPAKEFIHITSNQFIISAITILDVNGRVISNSQSTTNIDISQLNSGIYFIRIVTDSKLSAIQIFIKS